MSSNSFFSSCRAAGVVAARRLLMAHGVEFHTATRTSPKLPAPSLSFRVSSFQLKRLTTAIVPPARLDNSVLLSFALWDGRGRFIAQHCAERARARAAGDTLEDHLVH